MNPPLSARHTRGFTLMELMVVLVLMGIILSMTTLSVGDGGQSRKLEEEARRLVTLIRMAREEAILKGEDWKIVFNENSYKFQISDWQVGTGIEDSGKISEGEGGGKVVTHKIFHERDLTDFNFKLTVTKGDGKKVFSIFHQTDGQDNDLFSADDESMVVRIWPSGEITSFEVKIQPETSDDYFIITGNEFGELTLKNAKEL